MPALELTLRLALAFVLAAAVAGKLRSAESRDEYTRMFRDVGLPSALRRPAAAGLVAAELATLVLLVLPWTASVGAAAAVLLFATLTAGVHQIVRSERKVTCNCFGGGGDAELSTVHVFRNLFLVGLSVAALLLSLDGGSADLAQMAVAAFGAVIIAAVVSRLDELVDLLR
ncbi:MauE/DoxX family redox-associated membrane protein [Jidongwangia harbinensis]|uniref:MauE/DoxX family redox-associated membrane protein n=1 Tax=Jidongwangia harbinensis TaxID=2878561 RepID=UPI001CD96E47|nr:MauE/DoxX family redox-associated membrane protein [Jidongwangia harbinensis]MCA2213524.1 hypothetical protein [Jidongwangia harbinensis]